MLQKRWESAVAPRCDIITIVHSLMIRFFFFYFNFSYYYCEYFNNVYFNLSPFSTADFVFKVNLCQYLFYPIRQKLLLQLFVFCCKMRSSSVSLKPAINVTISLNQSVCMGSSWQLHTVCF